MTFDVQRYRIALQSLEDHCHTILEAHAEVPLEWTFPIHEASKALTKLLQQLDDVEETE